MITAASIFIAYCSIGLAIVVLSIIVEGRDFLWRTFHRYGDRSISFAIIFILVAALEWPLLIYWTAQRRARGR